MPNQACTAHRVFRLHRPQHRKLVEMSLLARIRDIDHPIRAPCVLPMLSVARSVVPVEERTVLFLYDQHGIGEALRPSSATE